MRRLAFPARFATFKVNQNDGILNPIEREATGDSFSPHFAVSLSESWLLVANSVTNDVSAFRRPAVGYSI